MATNPITAIQAIDDTVQNMNGSHFDLSPKVDQLLKWAPVVSAFFSAAAGKEPKAAFFSRLKILTVSEGIVNGVMQPLKKIVHRRRPGSLTEFDSFPSGHTATSFMGAEMLREASADRAPALAYAGYAIAVASAVLRVYQKKHWLSDVVAGAVLGIVSAQIAIRIVRKQREHELVTVRV